MAANEKAGLQGLAMAPIVLEICITLRTRVISPTRDIKKNESIHISGNRKEYKNIRHDKAFYGVVLTWCRIKAFERNNVVLKKVNWKFMVLDHLKCF